MSYSLNQYDALESLLCFLIEGLRTGSVKKGLIIAIADSIANFIPLTVTNYNKDYVLEPLIGATIYTLLNILLTNKTYLIESFVASLIILEISTLITEQFSPVLNN